MKSTRYFVAAGFGLFLTLAAVVAGRAQSVTLTFTPVVTGLSTPIDVVRAPSDTDRLFVLQKGGVVRIVKNGVLQSGSFLNIASIIDSVGEQGLLSLAFHPQHAANRMFWVVYNNLAGNLVLARYTTLAGDTSSADPASATIVTTIPHPTYSNHNGGRILFGPDGFLYWSTGDGGGGGDPFNNAQNGGSRLGKMLRLDVSTGSTAPFFSVPSTNPFVGTTGFDPLVYQYGLRNPFRWSFDRLNGDMWIADVGQGAWEEVDFAPAGAQAGRDWGWRCREGAHTYDASGGCAPGTYTGFTDPVYEYPQGSPAGGASITGGYVYRGTLYPALVGRYVCADYVSDNVFIVSPDGSGGFAGEVQTTSTPPDLVGFGENAGGELFAVSISAGTMYAISATGTPLALDEILNFTHRPVDDGCEIFSWNGSPATKRYALEWSEDARSFKQVGYIVAAPYEAMLCGDDRRAGFYRLRRESHDGAITYSHVLRLDDRAVISTVQLAPNPLRNGEELRVVTPNPLISMSVRDFHGRVTYQTAERIDAGTHTLKLPALPAGVYILQTTDAIGSMQTHRFIIQ